MWTYPLHLEHPHEGYERYHVGRLWSDNLVRSALIYVRRVLDKTSVQVLVEEGGQVVELASSQSVLGCIQDTLTSVGPGSSLVVVSLITVRTPVNPGGEVAIIEEEYCLQSEQMLNGAADLTVRVGIKASAGEIRTPLLSSTEFAVGVLAESGCEIRACLSCEFLRASIYGDGDERFEGYCFRDFSGAYRDAIEKADSVGWMRQGAIHVDGLHWCPKHRFTLLKEKFVLRS